MNEAEPRWVSPCVKRKIVREMMETSGVMHTCQSNVLDVMLGSSVNFLCPIPIIERCRTMLTAPP